MAEISVEEAIQALREQLQNAAQKGADSAVRFIPKSVEVELALKFDSKAELKGGLKFWSIFEASASGSVGDEKTHKVKLVLEPVDQQGKPTLISSAKVTPVNPNEITP